MTDYTWLLFDADDTLFDYPAAEAQALQRTFEQVGIPYLQEYLAPYQKYNQQIWREFERGETTSLELRLKRFKLLFAEIGLSCEPEAFSPRYLQNLSHSSQLIAGVPALVERLSKGYHLAVVTNGLSDVQRPRLERSGIHDFIENLFISEELGAAKPDPKFFEAVFREIGNPPKRQVLIVGDSLTSDMRGGLGFGIDTCWYNPRGQVTELAVTYEITRLEELGEILEVTD